VGSGVEAIALEASVELGGDETSDDETPRFERVVHDLDVVFDGMGGEIQKQSWKVWKNGGILV